MTRQTYGYMFIMVALILVVISGCGNNKGESDTNEPMQLTISVAASLSDVMNDIQADYETGNNVELTFNMGGSGKLAQQIQQGAPADVFISANQDWMDTLADDGLLMDGTREDITGNHLVLIKNKSTDLAYDSFEDLNTDDGQIAVGNPESVPAGRYAEQSLKSINKWKDLEGVMALAKNVRQVLTYVETGNAEAGFVYKSDALMSDKVEVMAQSEPDMHDLIVYPAAVLADTKHEKAAKAFIDYMHSDQVQETLSDYGFSQ